MKVVKLSQNYYRGFSDSLSKYIIQNSDGDLMLLKECKLISPDGKIVVFCKSGGKFEFSYSTVRNISSDVLDNFKAELTEQPSLNI